MYMYLEVAGPEFPGVSQLHNGYKTTGEQSLYDTHLSSLCQGGTTESGDGGGREKGVERKREANLFKHYLHNLVPRLSPPPPPPPRPLR